MNTNTIELAKQLFNETWELLDKPDRTPADNALMLHKAHASAALWGFENNPLNDARGEWQVSRVYSVLGFGEPALLHGLRSLSLCEDNNIAGLDLAFGYECVARACAALAAKDGGSDDLENAANYKAAALAAAMLIENRDDRERAEAEINSI